MAGAPFLVFLLAVSDDFVFLGRRATDFAADGLGLLAQCRKRAVAAFRNCGARFVLDLL